MVEQSVAEALETFAKIPEIKNWYSGIAPNNKETTRNTYMTFLMRYFKNEAPGQFLKRCDKDPKAVAIELKGRLGELYQQSMTTAKLTKYALKSFLSFHEKEVQVNGRMKIRRVRKKRSFKWEDAEKVIAESPEPYRSLFKFQLWSGLGEDEILEIQNSREIQKSIQEQRRNGYVKIDLTPRKSNLDEYYTLVPTQYVPAFPVRTRTSAPMDRHDLQEAWRRAAKRAKLYYIGLGAHTLRSSFRSQCGKADVAEAVSEFFMGHGSSNKLGYGREVLDEEYALQEINKLWTYNKGASREAYSELESKVKELTEWKANHEKLIKILEKEYKT